MEGDLDILKYVLDGMSPKDVKELLDRKLLEDENTPLHLAIKELHIDIAQYLVFLGADVNIQNKDGQTSNYLYENYLKEEEHSTVMNDNAKGGIDRLGFKAYARAIYTAVNQANPPLCVGINAEWGSGKSFLIEQIIKEFDPSVKLHKSTFELVQSFEDDYNTDKCKPFETETSHKKDKISGQIGDSVWGKVCYSWNCFSINSSNSASPNRPSLMEAWKYRIYMSRRFFHAACLLPLILCQYIISLFSYTFATILYLLRQDIWMIFRPFAECFDECVHLRKSVSFASNIKHSICCIHQTSDMENQKMFIAKSIEYIVLQFDAWLFKQSDELWTALIRMLYEKVELKLSRLKIGNKVVN